MGWWRRFFNGLLSKDKSLALRMLALVMFFLSVAAGVPKGEPHA
jgi:hypothetical protein